MSATPVSYFCLFKGPHQDDVEVEYEIEADERPISADPNSAYEWYPVSCERHLLDGSGHRVSTEKVRRERMLLVWADHLKETASMEADAAAEVTDLRTWSVA